MTHMPTKQMNVINRNDSDTKCVTPFFFKVTKNVQISHNKNKKHHVD